MPDKKKETPAQPKDNGKAMNREKETGSAPVRKSAAPTSREKDVDTVAKERKREADAAASERKAGERKDEKSDSREEGKQGGPKARPFQNARVRHGTFSVLFIVICIAAVVLVNILATVLANRWPLSLDVTAGKQFSISAENVGYINKLDKDVTLTVCAPKDAMTNGTYGNYITSGYGFNDPSGGAYFTQLYELLLRYSQMNHRITLQFIDPSTPAFNDIAAAYPTESFTYGDILVSATVTAANGTQMKNHKLLTYSDLLETQTDQSTYQTTITGSKVETAVTSAIYAVTSNKVDILAKITNHGTQTLTGVETMYADNNYSIVNVDDLTTGNIPADAEVLMIVAPTVDFSRAELDKISAFLTNGDKYGKTLLYVASSSQSNMPNMDAFLAEWGYTMGTGTVYETGSNLHSPDDNTYMLGISAKSKYTASTDGSTAKLQYYSQAIRPVTFSFDTPRNGYTTTSIIATSDTSVNKPLNSPAGWTPPSDAQKGPFQLVGLSSYQKYDADNKLMESDVVVIASLDFLGNDQYANSPQIGNRQAVLELTGQLVGRGASISFVSKTISTTSFTAPVASTVRIAAIVFMGIIPVGLVVLGIIIWVRRRHL